MQLQRLSSTDAAQIERLTAIAESVILPTLRDRGCTHVIPIGAIQVTSKPFTITTPAGGVWDIEPLTSKTPIPAANFAELQAVLATGANFPITLIAHERPPARPQRSLATTKWVPVKAAPAPRPARDYSRDLQTAKQVALTTAQITGMVLGVTGLALLFGLFHVLNAVDPAVIGVFTEDGSTAEGTLGYAFILTHWDE